MAKAENDPSERRRVGLIFDERMCKHRCPSGKHPENPQRIRAIWDQLNAAGIVQRCVVLNAKEAKDSRLAMVHSEEHIDLIKMISSKHLKTMRKMAKRFDSIYFNKGSSETAYLAAGSVIEAAEKVAGGELDSAFAIVRPPGHHAEEAEPMGFCLYNNVAIAASVILNERPDLGISKILIVDWDVHHGNGTQKMFYEDPRVLFFSVHRHDSGGFYPEGDDGSYNMIGEGLGAGYNINVPWECGGSGDADYFAIWDHILIPVAREFDPDMIIISAGFDAGKIVMALEGGYNLASLAESAQACVEVLLQDKPPIRPWDDLPLESTWPLIQVVRQALCVYWPILAAKSPDEVIDSRSLQIEVDVGVKQDEVDAQTPSMQAHTELEQARISDRKYSFEGRRRMSADAQNQSNQLMLTKQDPEEFHKSEVKKFADTKLLKKFSNFDEQCLALGSQVRNARVTVVNHVAEFNTAALKKIDFPSADVLKRIENIPEVLPTNSIVKDKGPGKLDKRLEKMDRRLEKLQTRMQHMQSQLQELSDSIKRKSDDEKGNVSDESQRQSRPIPEAQGQSQPKRIRGNIDKII